ncbi:MAG: fibronectin type III domain-containing protein, partial [Candidatus Marinimicrobia bacterium]|nr:fibronectin type III domain-containing protein [Candidatus Neomarinimicrobiota bacterium]
MGGTLLVLLLGCLSVAFGQPGVADSVLLKGFLYHPTGELCEHTPPEVGFIAYLNGDDSRILTDKAPRWVPAADPNIYHGVFAIELGNFHDPQVAEGDSFFIRLTCTASSGQVIYGDSIESFEWLRYVWAYVDLDSADIPTPPQNISVTGGETGYTVTWNAQPDLTYDVYRRNFLDLLPAIGEPRYEYVKVGEGLTAGTCVDTSAQADEIYRYIIFAKNADGIYSLYSEEAGNDGALFPIEGLTATAHSTTAELHWRPLDLASFDLAGYNIYRSTNSLTWVLAAYTGLDTTFTDSRLNPGQTYYYKLKGRTISVGELGESAVVSVQTNTSPELYATYASLKTAVVIYQNTNSGDIADSEIPRIKQTLEAARLFYWRNSGMKLNLELSYLPIKDNQVFDDPTDTWASMQQTADDLREMGVMNTQYDLVFRIC